MDVFSFGVLLLEIVRGKRNSTFHRFEDRLTLVEWAWKLWNEGRGIEVIDELLRKKCQLDEALRCIHVGYLCVQEAPADLPAMSSVIRMLQSNEATSLPPSKEAVFSIHRGAGAVGCSSQTPANFSNNELTVSLP
ncbi:G-type lectin S-receptor-like serine/threonine-protein kinase At4g03230 [Pyrus x bretschneideri]|uniref:G-type lectin S-receptor-like serine/threonine-protein kinase At4g03230 n=1 Tax=Pyrus x bretschneideri TaxID=225117 RepID=UPI0020308F61|nr:G-type lectin S-receptor-like serine/threonine-protein kinase At4g03230 [Pyrus x bretschneideri]